MKTVIKAISEALAGAGILAVGVSIVFGFVVLMGMAPEWAQITLGLVVFLALMLFLGFIIFQAFFK